MSALSPQRVKRWFKKSASEQYLYAKSLAPEQRSMLEQSLEQRFRDPQDPQAGAALNMWLSVQQARLRTHSPDQQAAHRRRLVVQSALPSLTVLGAAAGAAMFMNNRRDYHASPERPEYFAATSNFMRIIGDESLSDDMRLQVAQRLAYHCRSEGTLTSTDSWTLSQSATPESRQSWGDAIPATEPNPHLVAGAFAQAQQHRLNMAGAPSLEGDLRAQLAPLGDEITGWLAAAGQDGLAQAGAFDKEPLARSFARLLARRRSPQQDGNAAAAKVLQDGARVIRAVAGDPDLRGRVFAMAENALGTCGDNVATGFSSIVLAVGHHQMVKAVEQGDLDAVSLNRDTRQRFRLDVLEREVHHFIARKLATTEAALLANEEAKKQVQREGGSRSGPTQDRLTTECEELVLTKNRLVREPVETMLHAQVQLASRLDLPDGLPTTMTFQPESVLTEGDLNGIEVAIRAQETDGAALREFVLSDPDQLWPTAMKKLHTDALKPIWDEYDNDPVWLEDMQPRNDETFASWQEGYEGRCNAARQKAEAAELALLFRLAGM